MTKPNLIITASHRGGSWKSATSAGLAIALANADENTLLVDPAKAGGLASFRSQAMSRKTLQSREILSHQLLPLNLVKMPEILSGNEKMDVLFHLAEEIGATNVIVDLPMTSREELSGLLKRANLLLITIPVDVISFRSLPTFLEILKEERSLPGRFFDTRSILTGTNEESPRLAGLENVMREHLLPILLSSKIPLDHDFGKSFRSGMLPDELDTDSPLEGIFEQLASEILEVLTPKVAI